MRPNLTKTGTARCLIPVLQRFLRGWWRDGLDSTAFLERRDLGANDRARDEFAPEFPDRDSRLTSLSGAIALRPLSAGYSAMHVAGTLPPNIDPYSILAGARHPGPVYKPDVALEPTLPGNLSARLVLHAKIGGIELP
jgi:hypothetical protein